MKFGLDWGFGFKWLGLEIGKIIKLKIDFFFLFEINEYKLFYLPNFKCNIFFCSAK